MSIYNSAQQTVVQSIGGLFIGGVSDQFFHPHTEIDNTNAMQIGGEVLIQLGIVGLFTAGYFDFLARRGFREDSIKGLAFYLTMFGSQPHLISKISALSKYIGSHAKLNIAGSKAPENKINQTGYSPQNITVNAPGFPSGQNDKFNNEL